jgi:hypothetical protein
MNLGAEPKKVIALAVLAVVGVVVFWNNVLSTGGDTPAQPASRPGASRPAVTLPSATPQAPQSAANRSSRGGRTMQEFRPSLKLKKPEDRPDPMTVDPALRTDLLAKLQTVNVEGVHRSIFELSQPPAAKVTPVTTPKKTVPNPLLSQTPAVNTPTTPPPPPPPTPIPLKFYGYVSPTNQPGKRAFFLDGDEVHVVTEGELVKRRYKIVRIGINSVVVEDTTDKHQQTIPLEETPG